MSNFTATRDHNHRAIVIAPDGSAWRLTTGPKDVDEWVELPKIPFTDTAEAKREGVIAQLSATVATAFERAGIAASPADLVVGEISPAPSGSSATVGGETAHAGGASATVGGPAT